jgi:thermolabile hemolysin
MQKRLMIALNIMVMFIFSFILISFANADSVKPNASVKISKNIKGTNLAPPQYISRTNTAKAASTIGFSSYVRCYFYMDNKLTTLWGRVYDEIQKQYLYAEINGAWYSDFNPFYNIYYTKSGRDELINTCFIAYLETKHNPNEFKTSFINYIAARYSNSYDSEFWSDSHISNSPNSPELFSHSILSVNSTIKRLIVLGDSLSDTHNLFNKMQRIMPNHNGYFHGRFTNGPVWDEYVANYLKVNVQIFAEGGAEISPECGEGIATRSLNEQFIDLTRTIKSLPKDFNNDIANTLFIVFIGGNDFINQTAGGKADILANEYIAIIEKILKSGANYIMIPTYFDISITPVVRQKDIEIPGFAKIVHNDVVLFNQVVNIGILSLQQNYPHAKFLTPNFDDYMQLGIKEFTNIIDPCNQAGYISTPSSATLCSNALNYLFWDQIHPTAKAHCILGYHINNYLSHELNIKYPDTIDDDSCNINFIHI